MFRIALKPPTTTAAVRLSSHNALRRCWLSSSSSSSSTTTKATTGIAAASPTGSSSGPMQFKNAAERHEYLKAANAEMERYHHARELMRQGKLGGGGAAAATGKSTAHSESGKLHTGMAQLGVVTLFLVAFMATPLLGKRIATDDEFRRTWVPSWYDFTVPKPDKPWTRQELHEQMIAVQRDIRERAIRGDFAPEKLQELQKALQDSDSSSGTMASDRKAAVSSMAPAHIRKEWQRIHPGLEDGEEVNEG